MSDRWKAAIRWTDVVIGAAPHDRSTTSDDLSPLELAEIALTVAVAQGFSKAAIAWGPAPELPTMTIPTPGA